MSLYVYKMVFYSEMVNDALFEVCESRGSYVNYQPNQK